jgi:hypothetical protein
VTATEAPHRFTPEQVLAVFKAAGPFAAPMSTKQVGEAVRAANGAEPQKAESGRWHHDVSKTLAELVATGDLVTSRAPQWRKGWTGFDEKYQHLITPENRTERFYATPPQAQAWKLRREALAQDLARARRLADALIAAGEALKARPTQAYGEEPVLVVTLTMEQATEAFTFGDDS